MNNKKQQEEGKRHEFGQLWNWKIREMKANVENEDEVLVVLLQKS